jgi:tetratricopeptide (TPR) repeat protein
VAGMLGRAGRYAEGEAHLDRALEISRAIHVTGHWEIAEVRSALRTDEQKPKDALELAEQALPEAAQATGEQSTWYAFAIRRKAECLHDLGRDKEALPLFNQSLAILSKTDGPNAVTLLGGLGGAAESLVALRKAAAALGFLDRAFEVMGDHCPDPGQKAWLRFAQARALQQLGRDPARVRLLLGQVRDELAPLPWKKPVLDEMLAWAKAQRIALPPSGPAAR